MNIVSYIDPQRSLLPTTGVGRHMNNMLLGLAGVADVSVSTLFARQFAGIDGKLAANSPLRELPCRTMPLPISLAERMWKLLRAPYMDRWVGQADWVYLPEECMFPVRSARLAVTVHDCHAFETNLPWSNTRVHRSRRRRWSMWMGPMLARADRVLVVSEFTRRRIVELFGVAEKRIVVVGNGVEPEFFRVGDLDKAGLSKPVEGPYALVIGGLSARKGGEHVLRVAAELARRKSALQIVVAGKSEARLEEMARGFSNVKLLGAVSDATLPTLLRGAESLLFLSEYEGFGIPAIEAMAAGIPVVVSDRAALPETVGDAGIVVDPEDAAAVAGVLNEIMRNPRGVEELVQRGRKRAAGFAWSNCVDRLMKSLE